MISIVDDDISVRESLRDLIESLGYEVATFESAERFLEAACLPETSCLITDLQMPGLSGLDLQSRLIVDGQYIPEADFGVSGAMVRRRQDDGERRSPALASGTAPGRQEGSERWP